MVDVQVAPLDLSCPSRRPPTPDLSPASSLDDIRRLSRSLSYSDERSGEDERSEDSAEELERQEQAGPARKRFLSKFFRDPKGENWLDIMRKGASYDGGTGCLPCRGSGHLGVQSMLVAAFMVLPHGPTAGPTAVVLETRS